MRSRHLLLALAVATPIALVAGTVVVPHVFSNGAVADADDVNENFDELAAALNANHGRILALEASGTSTTVAGLFRASRYISGFSGASGPDLAWEGWTQCYGWVNDGTSASPSYASVRTGCGAGKTMLFAGYRSGSPTLIRHVAELSQRFDTYLPTTIPSTTYFDDFDAQRRYTWAIDPGPTWMLLSIRGTRWADPGRLWEPAVNGTAGATAGHVLSAEGNNANDQQGVTGDRYFIYLRRDLYASCAAIQAANPTATDGPYEVSPDGVNVFTAYCDMTGGGWTLIANQVSGSLLTNDAGNVNLADFGRTDKSWRLSAALARTIRPVLGWKMTDASNTVYVKPACAVDWSIDYLNAGQHVCTTGYTSVSFGTITNGAWLNPAVRGIGINNGGANCSIRLFNTSAAGVPVGAAMSCTGATTEPVRAWYK